MLLSKFVLFALLVFVVLGFLVVVAFAAALVDEVAIPLVAV